MMNFTLSWHGKLGKWRVDSSRSDDVWCCAAHYLEITTDTRYSYTEEDGLVYWRP